MSRLVGDRLPDEIVRAFDGTDLERKIGPAHLLITADEDGSPRPCMLSAGEIVAVDPRRYRVALWPGTNTSANLARGSLALLCFVAPGTVLYIRGRARALGQAGGSRLERFEIEVSSVESDHHGGMPVTQGIAFEVGSPSDVADSWKDQVAALRSP